MKILVINAGSSSLKYQLIDMDDESVMAKGLVDRIGIDDSVLGRYLPYNNKKCKYKNLKEQDKVFMLSCFFHIELLFF